MFVQVIQGHVSDAAQARAQLDKWVEEVAPGAVGWLGSTSGVTDDGTLIALARFESQEAAREGEQKEPPPQMQEMMKEMDALTIGQPVFFDLRDPWLHAPS